MQAVKILIGLVATAGLALFSYGAYQNGTDIPAGVLQLLSLILGAILVPEGLDKFNFLFRKKDKDQK